MTQIGTGTTPLHLFYDSRDRSTGYEQYNSSTTGVGLYYDRDVQGRLMGRYKSTITNGNWADAGEWFYHYTGTGDTPDYVRNSNWDIIEKTMQLPGGVNLTIKPLESVTNNKKQYSLPNVHGDTMLTANAAGTNTSNGNGPLNSFTYDPFGQVLTGSVLPANTAGGSYGWVGKHEKMTESAFALTPISMGARVYIPSLGRFTQVDPIEGGVENNYIYPTDPINEFDLTGEAAFLIPVAIFVGRIAVQQGVKYAAKQAAKQAVKNSAHSGGRKLQRGVTDAMIRKTVQRGIRYNDRKHPDTYAYVLRGGMASGRTMYVSVGKKSGKVVTVIARSKFKPGKRWYR